VVAMAFLLVNKLGAGAVADGDHKETGPFPARFRLGLAFVYNQHGCRAKIPIRSQTGPLVPEAASPALSKRKS
jgi:hypothetical protein